MNIVLYVLGLLGALVLLVWAARMTVDRMIAIAQAYELSDALIAMSVISVGTSLPEIASHVTSSIGILSGTLDHEVASHAVIGSNMGSSTVQQLLFLGVLILGVGRKEYSRRFFLDTYLPMLIGFALLFSVSLDGTISRGDGIVLLVAFCVYVTVSYWTRPRIMEVKERNIRGIGREFLRAFLGFFLVLVSAFFVLTIIEVLVERMNYNGSTVGVLSIGLAGALPELATVIESIRRNHPYLGLGTLVGSNVVNPLLGIGAGSVLSTYLVPPSLLYWDLPFKFGAGLFFLGWIYFLNERRGNPGVGVTMIAAYFVYLFGRMALY